MNIEEQLKALFNIPEDETVSPVEMAIEYETLMARLDIRKKYIKETYEKYVAENSVILSGAAGRTITAYTGIDELAFSDKCTKALQKKNVVKLGDIVNVTREELENEKDIGVYNAQRLEKIAAPTGIAFLGSSCSEVVAEKNTEEEVSDTAAASEDNESEEENSESQSPESVVEPAKFSWPSDEETDRIRKACEESSPDDDEKPAEDKSEETAVESDSARWRKIIQEHLDRKNQSGYEESEFSKWAQEHSLEDFQMENLGIKINEDIPFAPNNSKEEQPEVSADSVGINPELKEDVNIDVSAENGVENNLSAPIDIVEETETEEIISEPIENERIDWKESYGPEDIVTDIEEPETFEEENTEAVDVFPVEENTEEIIPEPVEDEKIDWKESYGLEDIVTDEEEVEGDEAENAEKESKIDIDAILDAYSAEDADSEEMIAEDDSIDWKESYGKEDVITDDAEIEEGELQLSSLIENEMDGVEDDEYSEVTEEEPESEEIFNNNEMFDFDYENSEESTDEPAVDSKEPETAAVTESKNQPETFADLKVPPTAFGQEEEDKIYEQVSEMVEEHNIQPVQPQPPKRRGRPKKVKVEAPAPIAEEEFTGNNEEVDVSDSDDDLDKPF